MSEIKEEKKNGSGRTSAAVAASRGSNDEGFRASRPARGPEGHRHRHPERTYAAERRRSSHARELIGLAHAGMDRACCDKPVRAAGMRTLCAGSRAMLSAHGHRRNDTPPTRCPLFSRTGHFALKCREFQITRCEKKSNGYQRYGEHGGNDGGGRNRGGSRNGGGGGNGRGGESGGVGGNRRGGKQKESSTDSESSDKTASPKCCFCLKSHRASECPNCSASTTAPATPNSQHGGFLGSVRTNLGSGLLVATSARPALAARGAPRERR